MVRSALKPLHLAGFPHLAFAYLVNEIGNWLGEIALAILVFDATGSPVATAGLFVAMQFVPAFTTTPLTVRIEAYAPRLALPGLYLAEGLAFAGLALLAGRAELALAPVLVLAAIDGTIAATARVMLRATAASILEPAGLLREGNGLMNVFFTAGAALGPALGGLLAGRAGVQAALVADAISFGLVAVLLANAPGLPASEAEGGWLTRLRDGLAFVRDKRELRRLIGAVTLAFVFFALVLPIEVVFAKESLDAGDVGYGILLAAWGTGMVLGGILFTVLDRLPLRALLVTSTAAIGLAYIGTGLSPTLAIACAASLIGGAGNGVQWVALVTTVQQLAGPVYQARVLAVLESLITASPGVGFLAGGAIAALLSPRASYLVAGGGVLTVLAATAWLLRDELTDTTPAGERTRFGLTERNVVVREPIGELNVGARH